MEKNYAKDLVNRIEEMSDEELIEYIENGDVYFLVSACGDVYNIEVWRNYAAGRMKITKDGCFYYENSNLIDKWYFVEDECHRVLALTEENFKGFNGE